MKESNNIQVGYETNSEPQPRRYAPHSWLGQASNDSVQYNKKRNT